MEIELGRAKRARRAYAFDDIAVVPSRRTRNPEDVSTAWSIDAFQFDIPVLGAPMDSVVSPRTAIMLGQLGGLGVLDLEGLWTRYDDPEPLLVRSARRAQGFTRDVAVVIDDHVKLALRHGLDGVHLNDGAKAVRYARKELGDDAIVGAFCGTSRHEGMNAAEAGADYVAFGPVSDSALYRGDPVELELFQW